MTCDEYQSRFLAGERSGQIDAHATGCAGCRAELDGLGRLRSALADPTVWEEPSADLEDRVIAEVLGQQAPGRDTGGGPDGRHLQPLPGLRWSWVSP
ncbi:MAG: hypothetical protein ACFCVC_15315 [Acidimicrobiia bacterium]